MTDVNFIWEELLLRFDYDLPQNREDFIEQAEQTINEFIEEGKMSYDEDVKSIMEALELKWQDWLKEKEKQG
jgi:vacuolar-type H+-ATPase subunit H